MERNLEMGKSDKKQAAEVSFLCLCKFSIRLDLPQGQCVSIRYLDRYQVGGRHLQSSSPGKGNYQRAGTWHLQTLPKSIRYKNSCSLSTKPISVKPHLLRGGKRFLRFEEKIRPCKFLLQLSSHTSSQSGSPKNQHVPFKKPKRRFNGSLTQWEAHVYTIQPK